MFTSFPLRQQMEIRNHWLQERLDTLLPALMARTGFDMWLVVCREYNEDPVLMSLLPQPALSARRRTILLFSLLPNGTVERLSLDRYGWGDFYQRGWDPTQESQWACLGRAVRERNPQRIGLNISSTFAFGDGLSHTEYELLADALGPELLGRTAPAERLAVGWLESRTTAELAAYPHLVEMGHALIAQAFSSHVIHPGLTTTADVVWWMRQTMQEQGWQAWFHPTVEIQAPDQPFNANYANRTSPRTLILPGDLLHCDVGFHYLGLATDQQQHAYVLRHGESDAPAGLKAALAAGNQLQDIHMAHMRLGRTGNEILAAVRQEALHQGLIPSVYSHPIGYHGHAAGPTIGLWDQQEGVPGNGDYPLYDNTCYSIELNIETAVPEWGGQVVRIALEEDAALINGQMHWLHGRQQTLHLIGN